MSTYLGVAFSTLFSLLINFLGGPAELECPRGQVISIALANYGRYSARVCYDNEDLDEVVPMTQCHNPRTMPTLRKRSVTTDHLLFYVFHIPFFSSSPPPPPRRS
ncbi:unnamed protein product [Nippostrongylus brasiliensis]|uniref:SUEL-type lectin domain-containing protein n=1 Tax=Nippostrongylus brasiliensis TaxID=27835 RepID=A0A3P7BW51_NIPBR|nr:unnamed protein product [Nippostrongylus brasiliensis]